MAWIKTVDENVATGELKEVYDQVIKQRGKLSNIMQIQSLNPAAMKAHMDFYLGIMFRSSNLPREKREMIAIVVSRHNQCEYCVNHHAEALKFYWRDDRRIRKFCDDYVSIDLEESDRRMLEYVSKLTKTPGSMNESDVTVLKENGFSDADILDINLITGYFNFVNRLANGLGVEFSEEEVKGYKY